MEVVDQIYRDTISIYLDGATGAPRSQNGTVFNRANSDIYVGNIEATNWPVHSFIYFFEGKIKRLSHFMFKLINNVSPIHGRQITMPWLIKELLDNIFVTMKVNAKEYFRKIPLSMLCDPTEITRALQVYQITEIAAGQEPTDFEIGFGPTQNLKFGSGGMNLAVPIEITKGDTVQLYWNFGNISAETMPLFFPINSGGGQAFDWNYEVLAVPQYQDYMRMDIEIAMKGTEKRIVQ